MLKIRVPMRYVEKLDFDQMIKWQRAGEIDKILEYIDKILLCQEFGLTPHKI